ncbi:hypothetical protein [Hoeflea olei]|uniref:Uncharacterized protein n=1 Tax=Hoeflea olei TaxID=1480615 RepID=A0A1C1YTC3_9HYPH|nr:hypothetical protein [Hoeflea olei]OCW56744.1 hypothetical protein AWJ14_17625 [Hoeflea olei]
MIRLFFFAMCLVVTAVMPARTQVLTSIPAAAADDPKSFWGAVMTEFYGPYDKRLKCWKGTVKQDTLCMRPHVLASVMVDGKPRHFVVMSGYAPGPDGARPDCHACGGKLGLVVLAPAGERLALVARNDLATDAGSWGSTPPEEAFRLVELGKGNYGWLMESAYTGQGYTEGGVSIFGVIGDRVFDLGFIGTYADNGGTCGDGMGACYTHSYEILADPASSAEPFGDLIARKLESTRGDTPDMVRIPYAQDTLRYEMPAALEAALGN